jgi:hypothetical protein
VLFEIAKRFGRCLRGVNGKSEKKDFKKNDNKFVGRRVARWFENKQKSQFG